MFRISNGFTLLQARRLPDALILLIALVLLAGCREDKVRVSEAPFHPDSMNVRQATEDSLFAVLQSIDQQPLRSAFMQIEQIDFTRYTRFEQFDQEDHLIAFEEQVVRHMTEQNERVFRRLDADSAGSFDYGYFNRFVSETVETQDPANPVDHLLTEDPAYLSSRNRDAYSYRLLPDTLMQDRMAHVIEVRALPDEGDGQNIRRVRFYIDRNSRALMAMYMERVDLALLFREESRFYVHVQPLSEERWVPYNTRFETRLRVPFRPPQRFRTTATYYDYGNER